MLTVILAASTAVLFGAGDFLGGFAARRESALAVTAAAHTVGLLAFGVALLLFPAPYSQQSVLAGASAGVFGGIGVAALFAGLARGRMSVVAPITAGLSGSIPAVYDFMRGSEVGPYALAGLPLAILATIIVSATSAEEEGEDTGTPALPPAALVLSLIAGFSFAGSFISFSFAEPDSGFWPLFAARVVSVVLLGTVALMRNRRLIIVSDARVPTFGAGIFDAAANVTMVSAIRIGPLAIASVIGSLYPVITVLLARWLLGERLRGWQLFGIVLALLAVVLSAIP